MAGDQGKFWEMHDYLFEHQGDWVDSYASKPLFIKYAKNLGMDVDVFSESLNDGKYSNKIKQDKSDGDVVAVDATPTFFINGQKVKFNVISDLKLAINEALSASK